MNQAGSVCSTSGQTIQEHDYALVICAFNEGGKIENQLRSLPPKGLRDYDVILGDDGSTDGSIHEGLVEPYGVQALLRHESNRGLSEILKTCLRFCIDVRYKGVILVNGNDKDDMKAVPDFIDKLKGNYGYIQGSRYLPDGHHTNTPVTRSLAIRFIHAPLFSLIVMKRFTDTTNGFRAFSMDVLSDPSLDLSQDFGPYGLEQYLAFKSVTLGYPCCEIPVSRVYPDKASVAAASISKISRFKGRYQMIKPLLCLLFRLYR